jgi:hypothetical protein
MRCEVVYYDGRRFVKQVAELHTRLMTGLSQDGEHFASIPGTFVKTRWEQSTPTEFATAKFKVILAANRKIAEELITALKRAEVFDNWVDLWPYVSITGDPAHIYVWETQGVRVVPEIEGILYDRFVAAWVANYRPPTNDAGGRAASFGCSPDYVLGSSSQPGYGVGWGDSYRTTEKTVEKSPRLVDAVALLLEEIASVVHAAIDLRDNKPNAFANLKACIKQLLAK